tara:strand:+ start:32 stop:955 length:924 start_codon:yes stop_codon:yes gene_type:complete
MMSKQRSSSKESEHPKRLTPINWVLAIAAGLLYSIALKYFVIPAGIILTGSEGIAVSISYYFENSTIFIVLYALFQTLLMAFAYRKISKTFAYRSLIVVATVILALLFLPEFHITQPDAYNERIMLVLFGGILAGCAKAVAFKNRGSTGDEDVIAAFYAMKYLKPVGSIAIIAGVVSTVFGLALQLLKTNDLALIINTLMYTALYLFVSTETLNTLYHKFKLTMLAVIHEHPDVIGNAIRKASPHRTYTIHPGVGGYEEKKLSMIRTIVTLEELPKLIAAINKAAPNAFYYHHEVEGVSRKFYISPI